MLAIEKQGIREYALLGTGVSTRKRYSTRSLTRRYSTKVGWLFDLEHGLAVFRFTGTRRHTKGATKSASFLEDVSNPIVGESDQDR